MKLTDSEINKQADAIFTKIKAHKDFKPTPTKGDGFICNIDTANEEVRRIAGGKLDFGFIADVAVANVVIELLKAHAPRRTETAQTPAPKPAAKSNGTTASTPASVVTPKVEQPKPTAESKPTRTKHVRELHGLELAQEANRRLQETKD